MTLLLALLIKGNINGNIVLDSDIVISQLINFTYNCGMLLLISANFLNSSPNNSYQHFITISGESAGSVVGRFEIGSYSDIFSESSSKI